jgi:hypothetical protein
VPGANLVAGTVARHRGAYDTAAERLESGIELSREDATAFLEED